MPCRNPGRHGPGKVVDKGRDRNELAHLRSRKEESRSQRVVRGEAKELGLTSSQVT